MTILRCAKLHLCVIFDETELGLEAVERAREVTIPGHDVAGAGGFLGRTRAGGGV